MALNFGFILKIWFREPRLEDGESVVWRAAANRQQSWRAVGGKLTLTTSRLIFKANRFDALTWGHDWSSSRDDIDESGVAERSLAGGPFTGGLRRRLRVHLADGHEELFVVANAETAAMTLGKLLAA